MFLCMFRNSMSDNKYALTWIPEIVLCMNEMMFLCMRVCLGNGMIYMCDLRMCLWHTQIFGQSWGQQMHRRKKLKERTECLIDVFYLLSSFCVCPTEWASVALFVLLSFLCTWLWSCHEDCRINCGFLGLWRRRSIISLRPWWEWFLVPSSLDRPFLLYFQPWQRESLLPGFYIPSPIRGFYFPHQLCLEWGISWWLSVENSSSKLRGMCRERGNSNSDQWKNFTNLWSQ